MQFHNLNVSKSLLRTIRQAGYTEATPIQSQTIPHILDGKDIVGCAQTGTGKTAAFVLPIIQTLEANPAKGFIRVLVLAPTRELAAQIDEEFGRFSRLGRLKHAVIFGGVGQQPQVDAIRRGVDILVATPGRLLDLMNQKIIRLDRVEVFVLDEADRMLDMGFIHDVKRIVRTLPRERQTLLFSATMPQEIQDLSRSILRKPVKSRWIRRQLPLTDRAIDIFVEGKRKAEAAQAYSGGFGFGTRTGLHPNQASRQ